MAEDTTDGRDPAQAPADDTPPEPGSRADLGLDKNVSKESGDGAAENIAEKGEPFDDNFA